MNNKGDKNYKFTFDDIKVISDDNIYDINHDFDNVEIINSDNISNNDLEQNLDTNYIDYNITPLKIRKKMNVIKLLIIICPILISLISLKLFILNDKNEFLKETSYIYDKLLNNLENINKEFDILSSEYVEIDSNIELLSEQKSDKYKVQYIEDEITNKNKIQIYCNDEIKDIINTNNLQNLDLFGENNYSGIKHSLNLIKRTLYKSLEINKFKSLKNNDNKIINLTLNDKDIKKSLRRVLQKIKLNKTTINLISGYTGIEKIQIKKGIDNLLTTIDKTDFKDLNINIYYNKKAYKYTINYDNIKITYNINNKNFIVEENNNKLIDINIEENRITSNKNSMLNLTYEKKEIDGINTINVVSEFDNKNEKINMTILYELKSIEENKYILDLNASTNSSIENIKSIGIKSNNNIINKK